MCIRDSLWLINGYKVSIRKELKDTFFVGTGDRKIADILGLNRTCLLYTSRCV